MHCEFKCSPSPSSSLDQHVLVNSMILDVSWLYLGFMGALAFFFVNLCKYLSFWKFNLYLGVKM